MASRPNISVTLKKDEPVERALRRFKRLCDRAGISKIVRSKRYYEKPSDERRRELRKGIEAVQAEIQSMAERAGDNADRVRSYYSNPQEMMRLHYRLLEERTVDYLREKSSLGARHECGDNA